jgi:hypothetical protein
MAFFPVIDVELEEAERALGIRLPDAWKAKLGDPKIQRALQDRKVGSLRATDTMAKFVELTMQLRERYPEFPRGAVVMVCGQDRDGGFQLSRGYARVCLPDKRDPSKLGDFLHSWDLVRRRLSRDCSTQDMIDSHVGCASPELLAELGLAARDPWGEAKPLATRGAPDVLDMLEGRATPVFDKWLPCGEMRVAGRFLTPCDLGQYPTSAHASVAVEPGQYEAWIRLGPNGAVPVVRAARLSLKGAGAIACTQVATLDVDLAAIAVFDRQGFFKSMRSWDRDSFGEQLMELKARPMFVAASRKSELFVTPTGAGDGTYPIFALHEGERAVGIELRFENQA